MVNRRLPNTASWQNVLIRLPYLGDQVSDIHNVRNDYWIVSERVFFSRTKTGVWLRPGRNGSRALS